MPCDTHKVLLTRRRWDLYMVPLLLGALAVGFVRVYQTGQLRYALTPIAVVPFWFMLRIRTPREGMRVSTIRSTPGAIVMICFGAASMTSFVLLSAIDVYVFHHSFRAPLELYHAALFAPPFVIMFTGACCAGFQERRRRVEEREEKREEVAVSR